MQTDQAPAERVVHPALVHFALAVGGFAIGTTEFATMSLLPYFARDLGIGPGTVKTHVERLIAKLGVADRTQAAVFAVRTQA